ncbi:TubC N-terminal docking domain-related protein [Acidithiobacillus sp.]
MKTSNPSLLVEKLKAAGFTLSAEGSRLRVMPADSLTDELRQSIREHRAGLVRILAAETAPAAESYHTMHHPSRENAAQGKYDPFPRVLRYMPVLPSRYHPPSARGRTLRSHWSGSAVWRLWL